MVSNPRRLSRRGGALQANHQMEEESSSEMSIDEGGGTSKEESYSEEGASPSLVSKVRNLTLTQSFRFIKCLSKDLFKL